MPLTPNNREEHWLKGMVDGQTDLTPNKRREYWYKEIVDAIGSGGGGGTGGGVLVVNANIETGICDKTWKEINDASFAVIKILDDNVLSTFPVVKTNSSPDGYVVKCVGSVGNETIINNAVASSENDYPVVQFD